MVVKAGNPHTPRFEESLARLCAAYWQSVYAFIRGNGFNSEDARDYTQEFLSVRKINTNLSCFAQIEREP